MVEAARRFGLRDECVIDRRAGMSCMICQAADRPLLFRKDEASTGICEPCSHYSGWAWRQLAGEVPPGFPEEDLLRVSTVCALIARRREIPKLDAAPDDNERIIPAPAELNSSYEFLLAADVDGTCSVPSLSLESHPERCKCSNCSPHRGEAARPVLSLLSSFDLRTWPALLEPLYTAYSPRGRLVGVTLIRGWAEIVGPPANQGRPALRWRSWPLSEHTGDMSGFWRTMETVWTLRLHKHCAAEDTGDLCVHLREAACRYIELQVAVRTHQPVDASMLPVYRAAMSADEVATERLIQLAENRAKDERSLAVIPRDEASLPHRPPPKNSGEPGSEEAWDEQVQAGVRTGLETDDGPQPDGEEDSPDPDDVDGDPQDSDPEDDSADDPSFVRPRRPLRR
jgi:hypothetical protein